MDQKDVDQLVAALKASAAEPAAPQFQPDAYTSDKNRAFNWAIPTAIIAAITAIVSYGIYLHQRDEAAIKMVEGVEDKVIERIDTLDKQITAGFSEKNNTDSIKEIKIDLLSEQVERLTEQQSKFFEAPRYTAKDADQAHAPIQGQVSRHGATIEVLKSRVNDSEEVMTRHSFNIGQMQGAIEDIERKLDK